MPDMWFDVDAAITEAPVNIFPLTDATDFKTIEDAVAYNAAGMALYWHFVTSAGAYTLTAVTPTTGGNYDWTDQGAAGIYTIEIPASGGASINNDTEGYGWFTGSATGVLPWRGPVIGFRAAALNDSMCDTNTTGLLAPTTAGRTLDVTAGGNAGVDWANVETPGSTVSLSATTVATVTTTTTATNVTTVNGLAANVITAASIATGAIDADAIADGAIDAGSLAADCITAAKIADDAIATEHIATGAISADSFAADAITAAKIAADVTTELQSGLATAAALDTVDNFLDTEIAAIKTVTDAIGATGTGLSAIPWNAAWDAEVQSEATDALNASGLIMANGTIGATGNDTTHLHLTGLTYGNDEINNCLLVVRDVSTSESHARWIEDWVDAGDLATVATLPFTPEDSVDTYWLLPVRQDVTGGSGLDAAGVRAAVGLASANLDTQLGDIPTNAELSTALGTADDATLAAVAAVQAVADEILLDTAEIGPAGAGLTAINLPNQTMDIVGNITGNLSGSVGSVTAGVSVGVGGIATTSFAAGAIDAAALAANAITSSEFAQSAADKVFGTSGAALPELSQGAPSATPRPDQALMLLYMMARNASKSTATERQVLNDAGTVIAKATMSDNGTTFDQGELVTGP